MRAPSASGTDEIHYVLCQDEASRLFLANLGCIEINPWNSRVGHLDEPDYLVIDLDPEGIGLQRAVEAAQAIHRLLDSIGAESYCKTSRTTGLHVHVPLGALYSVDAARRFAQLVATVVQRELPDTTSTLRKPALRQRRVYLDYLQNRSGQTLAAPYTVGPVAGATVSTPLKWGEDRRGLDPTRFTMRSVHRRIDRVSDLWKPVLGGGVDLSACPNRLAKWAPEPDEGEAVRP